MIRSLRLSFAALLALVALNVTAGLSRAAFTLTITETDSSNNVINTYTTPSFANSNAIEGDSFGGPTHLHGFTDVTGTVTLFSDFALTGGNPSDRAIQTFQASFSNSSSATRTLTFTMRETGLTSLPTTSTGSLVTQVSSLNFFTKNGSPAGINPTSHQPIPTPDKTTVQGSVYDSSNSLVFSNPLLTLNAPIVGGIPAFTSAVGPNPVNFTLQQMGSVTLAAGDNGNFVERTDFITPEPTAMTLWGIGLAVCGFSARRRRNAKTG